MAKLILSNLANLQNEETATATINSNNDFIELALENTLSRDGTTPNSMLADFDMNSHRILNLPAPASQTDAVRLQDVTPGIVTVASNISFTPNGDIASSTVQAAIQEVRDDAATNLAANITHTSSGKLTVTSATAIKFAPYNGDRIKVNGTIFSIPSAGIAGGANTSVFVNGAAGQNLAASTVYYVYCFSNAGVLTFDFSTTTRATSSTAGNVGVEIKSGDNTRSLIGLLRTDASSQFSNFTTLSWFNRGQKSQVLPFTTNRTTTSAGFVEINTEIRNIFISWSDNNVFYFVGGTASSSTTGTINAAVALDSTTILGTGTSATGSQANFKQAISFSGNQTVTEGVTHFLTFFGATNAGTVTYIGGTLSPPTADNVPVSLGITVWG